MSITRYAVSSLEKGGGLTTGAGPVIRVVEGEGDVQNPLVLQSERVRKIRKCIVSE